MFLNRGRGSCCLLLIICLHLFDAFHDSNINDCYYQERYEPGCEHQQVLTYSFFITTTFCTHNHWLQGYLLRTLGSGVAIKLKITV